jgi:hypothetical protein
MEFTFTDVNDAIVSLPTHLKMWGIREETRNGPVISMRTPVMVHTTLPMRRVLMCPKRKANPFLFLLDGLSILSRVPFVKPFADIVPRFREYSDDGVTLRAHYGRRLADQIPEAIQMLREQQNSRRVTMAIWNPNDDLGTESRDIPCNVHVNLRIVGGCLDLTVFNRSNDLFWGMLGANIVQFSFLLEYIAAKVGVRPGVLTQVSTNLHAYTGFGPGKGDMTFTNVKPLAPTVPLDTKDLVQDLDAMFMRLNMPGKPYFDPGDSDNAFLSNVVFPMLAAWHEKDLSILEGFPDCDWFEAARMYGVR